MVSHANLFPLLSTLDWAVFIAVLIITFLSVLYGQHLKSKLTKKDQVSSLELLLMGRSLTLPIFVATLTASWYGGILGVTSLSFEKGLFNFLTQGIFWYGSYLIFAFFLVKRIRGHKLLTLAEIAGKLFGTRAEKLTASLNFLNLLPLAYTISLGVFLKAIFGGSLFFNTFIGVTIVSLWSLWGGFRAVVFTDVVQFFFMILGVFLVVLFAWLKMGNPLVMAQQLPPAHLSLTGGESLGLILVWGFIALSTLVDPNFYQKVLAAKTDKVARNGILISTLIWIFFDICTTLGALYARVALPDANAHDAYLLFSMQLVPDGIRGLILAGILATILSTLDAYLFNAATSISYDFFKLKDKFKLWHHHLAILGVAGICIFIGPHFEGNIIEVWKTLGSFSAACLLFPMLVGHLFPGRISETAFCWGVSLGVLSIVTWRILAPLDLLASIDPFYVGLFFTSIPMLIGLISRRT